MNEENSLQELRELTDRICDLLRQVQQTLDELRVKHEKRQAELDKE